MNKKARARRAANAAIEAARGTLVQVETHKYVNHQKSVPTSFDTSNGDKEAYERDCPNVITFHVMKR